MSPTSILDLPPEVLAYLVTFLPTPCLARVARTSRHFQYAAEQALYTSIDLHPKVDFVNARSRYPDLLEAATESVGPEEDGFYVDIELGFLIRLRETAELIRRVRGALLASPARTASVKRMAIYVITGLNEELLSLLDHVRATLLELDIAIDNEVSCLHDNDPEEDYPIPSRDFWATTERFAPMTQLRRLAGDSGSQGLHDLTKLLRWAPSLVSLDLAIAQGFDARHDSASALTRNWPKLETLHTLRLTEVEAHFLPFISALIDRAPALTALAIHSIYEETERIPKAVAEALRGNTNLRYLEWVDVSRVIPLVDDGSELLSEGFDGLETLVQGSQPWSPMCIPSRWPELHLSPNVRHYMFAMRTSSTSPQRPSYNPRHLAEVDAHADWATEERVRTLAQLRSVRCFDCTQDETPRSGASWRDLDHGFEIRTRQISGSGERLVCFLPRYGCSSLLGYAKTDMGPREVQVYSGSQLVPEEAASTLYATLRRMSAEERFDEDIDGRLWP